MQIILTLQECLLDGEPGNRRLTMKKLNHRTDKYEKSSKKAKKRPWFNS